MNKINKKGFTIIEMILSFSFIMIISVGLFISATNYKNKQQKESARRDLETYKMNIINDIHKEIDKRGFISIEKSTNLNNTIVVNFNEYDNMQLRWDDNYTALILFADTRNRLVYYLKDRESSRITNVSLESSSETIADSKIANIYKITININHDELGDFPIDIILSSFSNE